jgi:hypothetical protein
MLTPLFPLLRKISRHESVIEHNIPGVSNPLTIRTYTWPFRHAVIDNFLNNSVASEILEYYEGLRHISDNANSRGFHYLDHYSQYNHTLTRQENATISNIFYSHELRKFAEQILDISASKYTHVDFHLNLPRQDDKRIHTDTTKIVFQETPNEEMAGWWAPRGIRQYAEDNYFPLPPGSIIKQRIATCILYLNEGWSREQGGGTGIYARRGGKYIECASIKPAFNRYLMFRNTPVSLHNMQKSTMPIRRSLIQWYHT